jgi:excisionase family DNA binding protein
MTDTFSLDDLLNVFAAKVAEKVSERAQQGGVPKPRLLTVDQAAEYLACTPDAIRHKVANRRLPAVKIDRKLRFDIQDLDRVIQEAKL